MLQNVISSCFIKDPVQRCMHENAATGWFVRISHYCLISSSQTHHICSVWSI